MQRSEAEIEDLKQQWLADPCWDIETSEGFEGHRTELLTWKLTHQRDEAWKRIRNYQDFFATLQKLLPKSYT